MIRVQSFSGAAGLHALAPSWRLLTAQLTSKRHFHHVEWYLALAETFEEHHLPRLECIAVFSDETLVAVFPFRVMPLQIGGMKLNALKLASDQIDADTARDFVLADSLANTNFFQGFVKYMAEREPAWDVIVLPGILEDSLATGALKHSPQLPLLQTRGGAWGRIEIIPCGHDDQPLKRLSKGFRQNLRTAHNKFRSMPVAFTSARTTTALLDLLPEFLRIESSGWKGEMGTSALKQAHTVTFLRRLISHFGPIGGCEIQLLRVNDEYIATLFGIVADGIWYVFRIGYDERYHRSSPGHLMIENLIAESAVRGDFHAITPYNAPPWFQLWKPARVLQVYNGYVFRPSPKGLELGKQVAMTLRALA